MEKTSGDALHLRGSHPGTSPTLYETYLRNVFSGKKNETEKAFSSIVYSRAATVYFWQAGRHSGGHFISVPPLLPPFSIYQNPAKDQALDALPPVAALVGCAVNDNTYEMTV